MKTIDVFCSRHGNKDKSVKVEVTGDKTDRGVPLSQKGMQDTEAFGRVNLRHDYSRILVVTSDFLRTKQTAENALRGAGYNIDELLNNPNMFTRKELNQIGLTGVDWEHVGCPPYSSVQAELDRYVQHHIQSNYLVHADDPENTRRLPVLARCNAAFLGELEQGLEMIESALAGDQKGLILVVTHSPIINGFAEALSQNVRLRKKGEMVKGKEVYEVRVEYPIEAFNEGHFIQGRVKIGSGIEFESEWFIKGNRYIIYYPTKRLAIIRDIETFAAYHGVQR